MAAIRDIATYLTATLLSLLVLLPAHTTAQLQLYTSGAITTPIKTLESGDIVCPSDYASAGINIRCVGADSDPVARFFVDGTSVNTERKKPFFIAGDKNNNANVWDVVVPSTMAIECRLASVTYSLSLTLDCGGSASSSSTPSPSTTLLPASSSTPSVSPSGPAASTSSVPMPSDTDLLDAAEMYFVRTDGIAAPPVKIVRNMRFCPHDELGTQSDFTVLCAPSSTSTVARFRIDGIRVSWDGTMPFYITADAGGSPAPWTDYPMTTDFRIQCVLNDGSKKFVANVRIECPSPVPSASPLASGAPPSISPMVSVSPIVSASPTPSGASDAQREAAGCVIIPARGVPLAPGWTLDTEGDGVTFQANNRSKKVTKKDVSSLNYTFTAVKSGRHAVVVDMTTRGGADYNDVWVGMPPGGLQLMKNGVAIRKMGLVKGYHNANGRAAVIGTVDHNTHSISSWTILEQGEQYRFVVGGRSNRLTLHRVILFVCEGTGCQRWHWRDTQDICAPGSNVL